MTPNFTVFDRNGNLYFSDSGQWDYMNGCVYRMSPDGKTDYFVVPFAFANGLTLSADDHFLYVAESQRDRVVRISIRALFNDFDPKQYLGYLSVGRLRSALRAAKRLLGHCKEGTPF